MEFQEELTSLEHSRASPCRIPKELCEKPVLQTGIKSTLPVPSALKGWEGRGGLGMEVAHLIWEQILSCMEGWEAGMGMMDRRKQMIKK